MIKYKNNYYITYLEIQRMDETPDEPWYKRADRVYNNPDEFHHYLDMYKFLDDICQDDHIYSYRHGSWLTNYTFPLLDYLSDRIPNNFNNGFGQAYVSDYAVYVFLSGCGQCEDELVRFDSWENYFKTVTGGG